MKNKIVQTVRYYKPEIVQGIGSKESIFYLSNYRHLKTNIIRTYNDIYGNMCYDIISNKQSHEEIKEIKWESDNDVPINSKIKIGENEYLVNDKVYNLENTITYYVGDAVEKCENYDELFENLYTELKLNKKKNYKNLYSIINKYKNNRFFIENYIYKIKNNETGYEYEIKNHEWYKYEKEYYGGWGNCMNKKELKQLIEDILSQYYKVTSYNGGITIINKIRTLHFEFYTDESLICFNNSDTGTIIEFIAYTKDELLLNLIKLKGEIISD